MTSVQEVQAFLGEQDRQEDYAKNAAVAAVSKGFDYGRWRVQVEPCDAVRQHEGQRLSDEGG